MIAHGAEKIINANTDEYVTSLSRRSFISLLIRRHCHQGPHQRRHQCSGYHSVRRRAHDRAERQVRGAHLNNFKLDASVQQWEGEDFRAGVRLSCVAFCLESTC